MIESMSQSFEFQIAAEDAGRRLDEFLASRFGGLSRLRLQNLVKAGACLINDAVMPAGWRLATGDVVKVTLDDAPPTAMQPEAIPLDILYEDEQIIVVVKPAGMLVHPNKGAKRGTLANALAYHLNRDYYDATARLATPAHGEAHQLTRPGLIHRLDRATSGVMVVAKTQQALSQLSRHFIRRLVKKRYLALVTGRVVEDAGQWQAPIARRADEQPHWWVSEGGKPSVTNFTVRERFAEATLLELEPVTGRTNQLRIHAAYFGYPIIGDELYGMADDRSRVAASRLCLHAWRLAFHHPASGEWREFVAPLPEDFARLLDQLRGSGNSVRNAD
ncbi:MAG TPA: RluA family pseudouridine synthase [Blastocatellia bacterium]|nr:RluA family pseudouridine synthase [Blastocatellia bacterium]